MTSLVSSHRHFLLLALLTALLNAGCGGGESVRSPADGSTPAGPLATEQTISDDPAGDEFSGGGMAPVWSRDGGSIGFWSTGDVSDLAIWVMSADGTVFYRLASDFNSLLFGSGAAVPPPSLSPDGRSVAFDDDGDIYIGSIGRDEPLRLTDTPEFEIGATWSPDRTRLAFMSWDDSGQADIVVVNADGSALTNITNTPGDEYTPVWSPAGGRIAFARSRDIWVMNADGTNAVNLTTGLSGCWAPAWSADGKWIAFRSDRDAGSDIYIVSAEGGAPVKVASGGNGYLSVSPDGSLIAFARDGEIFVANTDGSGEMNLTTSPVVESNPAFSPDGALVAFDSDGIYVTTLDGSSAAKLTPSQQLAQNEPGFSAPPLEQTEGELVIVSLGGSPELSLGTTGIDPAWSPDGSQIAFSSRQSDPSSWFHGLFVIGVDGTSQRNLSEPPTSSIGSGDQSPTWSPDGSQIAFASQRSQPGEVLAVSLDGLPPANLTNSAAWDGAPSWSPDGSRIAFVSTSVEGKGGIYVMNADGTEATRLVDIGAEELAWSPDGTQLLFATIPNDEAPSPASIRIGQIHVVNADGTELTAISDAPGQDMHPDWSPDGSRVVFTSWRDGTPEIYVMQADGSDVTRLTTGGGEHPAWSPDGSKIAFLSGRDGNLDVYVMGSDGSNLTNLTNNELQDFAFAWSPDGTRIVVARAAFQFN